MHKFESGLLPAIARNAIAKALNIPANEPQLPELLFSHGASFVTLHLDDRLRGCVGSLMARRSLLEDIKDNALSAAFKDYRFQPLNRGEFGKTAISVSVLSVAEPMSVESETDAIHQLNPGVDGVILDYNGNRGTFLPQVWHQLPDAAEFLAQLKRKAGLPPDFWHLDISLYRYSVEEYKEENFNG